jgi:hypothetical protein
VRIDLDGAIQTANDVGGAINRKIVTGITAGTAIPGEIAATLFAITPQGRAPDEDQMSTMRTMPSDLDPDMRLLHDDELDVVIGGVSGGGFFQLPQVLSALTSVAAGADPVAAAISARC